MHKLNISRKAGQRGNIPGTQHLCTPTPHPPAVKSAPRLQLLLSKPQKPSNKFQKVKVKTAKNMQQEQLVMLQSNNETTNWNTKIQIDKD